MGGRGVSHRGSDPTSGWQTALSRYLVRQAAAGGIHLFTLGRAHWSAAANCWRSLRFSLLPDGVAVCARAMECARGRGGGVLRRVLPDVWYSFGRDGVGARFVDGATALRRGLPGMAQARILVWPNGRGGEAWESQ